MLFVMDDFLIPDACRNLREYLVDSLMAGKATAVENQHESFFHGRQIDLATCDDDRCRAIMLEAQDYAAQIAGAVFQREMEPDYSDLVLWPTGMEMVGHVDCNAPFNHRVVSAVAYLSDDFEGGQTFLEGYDDVTPKTGRLAMYQSITVHGLRPITRGDRHTLAMWFKPK